MRVFLRKDVERVGLAGEIIKVTDGFAMNYLIPQGLGIIVTEKNESQFKNRAKVIEHRKEVLSSQTSMRAEKIKSTELVLKRKIHDDNKLYGSISAGEVVDLLAAKGISVSKSQVHFDKSIKESGNHLVTIKLSSKLQPQLTLKIVPE
jgi:large subunit ribosomal protein L9